MEQRERGRRRHETMDLRQEVELTLLPGVDGTSLIIEWQLRGTRFNEVKVASSSRAARAWVEAHYEDVEWDSQIRGSALIGALADDDRD
jgi:hypothetical protein